MTDLNKYYQLSEYIAAYTADEERMVPAELEAWLSESESNRAIFDKLVEEQQLKSLIKTYKAVDVAKGWDKVSKELQFDQPAAKTSRLFTRIAAAAAVLLVLGSAIFFYNRYTNPSRHLEGSAATRDLLANDIKPGGNKAYLTLASGKRLSLTDAANGAIANEAGVEISKTANGQVIYSTQSLAPSGRGDEAGEGVKYSNALNTIETPKGGQYQVRLPDGTKVWLNAASKLSYPVSFNGREDRRVELSGEAYFEVAKDKAHPFKVKSNSQEVQVLGTHFNINSYADEVSTKTTLLEGSVKVTSSINGRHPGLDPGPPPVKVLKPGQQSINDGKIIKVNQVDTELAIAWKNNKFIFEKDNIQYIMRMIERWYNVQVIYSGPLPTGEFGGSMSKYENVDEVLKPLESTGKVKFRIEGRKIIVSK